MVSLIAQTQGFVFNSLSQHSEVHDKQDPWKGAPGLHAAMTEGITAAAMTMKALENCIMAVEKLMCWLIQICKASS